MSTTTDQLRMLLANSNMRGQSGSSSLPATPTEELPRSPPTNNADEPRATPNMPQVGQTFAEKYRIDRIIGRGGMGVVAAVMHLQLEQRVAVKFLLEPGDPVRVARFLREARAASCLRSMYVARVMDVGLLESRSPYMVMEYLEGRDLAEHIRTIGRLDIPEAVEHLLQACEAMAEAHAAGIVHRDLKPSNLYLTTTPDGEPCIKVLDFGISKMIVDAEASNTAESLTKPDARMGTPSYMSPEQIESSKDVDHRSDVWALGVILYQLLTGHLPWSANPRHTLATRITMTPTPPLAQFRPGIPAGLENAIMRCLEKRREQRFQNVAELAWAIAEYGPPHADAYAKRAMKLLEAKGFAVQLPVTRTPNRRRGIALGAAMAAMVLLGVGGTFLARGIADDDRTAPVVSAANAFMVGLPETNTTQSAAPTNAENPNQVGPEPPRTAQSANTAGARPAAVKKPLLIPTVSAAASSTPGASAAAKAISSPENPPISITDFQPKP